jgi:hypothetical protein
MMMVVMVMMTMITTQKILSLR